MVWCIEVFTSSCSAFDVTSGGGLTNQNHFSIAVRKTRMALLIQPNGEAKVVPKNFTKHIDWRVEMWPYCHQVDTIVGSNGKKYRFDVYVDEEGLLKQLQINRLASYFADPLADRRAMIYGPAVVVPLRDNVSYTLADFNAIYEGVVGDLSGDEDEESLPDKNALGKRATIRLR